MYQVPSVCATVDPHATAREFDECVERARVLLSNSHTCTRRWIEVADGAPYVRAREIGRRQPKPPDCGRGLVTSFSERSRRRLMALGASIKTAAMMRALFVTLTYPQSYDPRPETWQADFRAFEARVRRKFPHACIVWKLEFQHRGAPHFHLIVLNVPYMAYQWVNRAWREIVSANGVPIEYIRTEVRRVKRQSQVLAYVNKYVAKPGTDIPTGYHGRFWGVYGREYLPVSVRQVPCSENAYDWVLGRMKHILGWDGDPLDRLTYSRGLWLALDQRTKRAILKPLGSPEEWPSAGAAY